MKVIGITGPTGAGKTTALNALRSLGGQIIDADAVYHDLTWSFSALRAELEARFGPVYNGEIPGPEEAGRGGLSGTGRPWRT
ncbi:MAG: dephospho-CoA kinase [Evtepia gabavorous]